MPLFSRLATLTLGFFIIASPALAQQEASFQGLGDLPGGLFSSTAIAVSADGSVVVGRGNSTEGPQAFRWEAGSMAGLGDLPGGDFSSTAESVTPDGSVVVGRSASENGTKEAFRWEAGTMEGLGDLPGGIFSSRATDISADGSVIVGQGFGNANLEAFRWEADADTMIGLGRLSGSESGAWGVSADGNVVVGHSTAEGALYEPFRWEAAADTMIGLGSLPGGSQPSTSWATDVSSDGSFVVGRSDTDPGDGGTAVRAFRWGEDSLPEMFSLGEIPDADADHAYLGTAVSADGSVVVGYKFLFNASHLEAFIWTDTVGMRSVKDVLESDYGLDLTGWTLQRAYDVTDDGTVIVGVGTNPDGNTEAWRAVLPFAINDDVTPEALADILSVPSPNPASGTTTFTIAVAYGQHVAVEVFDVTGRRVQTVYKGVLAGGMSETLRLDASALPAGVYAIRAVGENFTETRNITVVK